VRKRMKKRLRTVKITLQKRKTLDRLKLILTKENLVPAMKRMSFRMRKMRLTKRAMKLILERRRMSR
jgi:hypothetical protein